MNGQRYPMNVTVDKDANDNPVITATYSFSIGTPPEEPSQEASYEVALLNYGEEYSPENELSTVTVDVNDRSEYNFYLVQTDAEGTRTPVDTSLYDLTFELPSGSQNALVKAYQGQTFYKLSVSGINEAEENLTLTATFKESSESVTKTVPLEVNDTGSYPDFSLAIYGIEYNYRPDRALSNLEEDFPYIVSLVRTKEDGSYSVVDTDLYTIDIQIAKGDTYAFVSDPYKLDDGYAFSIEGKGDTRVSDNVIVHAEGAFGSADLTCPINTQGVTHTHSYGKWTDCKDGINHQRSCSCGDVQKEAHAWDSAWVVTTKPTCTEKGKKTRTCTKCGKTETASIPAVGHSFGEYKITKQPTALATGTKTRTCTKCGKTESIAIAKLKPIIALSVTKLPLQLKKSTTVLKVTKMQTGDKVASFTSSNSKIVTVHKTSGKLTAKKVGKAIITVKLKSGKSAKCVVTVQKTPVKTTKIQVKPSSLKLKKGKKVKLATVLTPLTSQEKVTFTSSNKKIATVSSSGVVTAKKKGKVKITAKSGKKKVTCTITVTAK